jgi:hypothetical protein
MKSHPMHHTAKNLGNTKNMHDPLVIQLTPNTQEWLSSLASSNTYYDMTGSGVSDRTGWVQPGNGFLVTVDSSGGVHLITGSITGGSGFSDLAAMDSNNDGIINAEDPAFSSLYVWEDTNSNGTVDPGELHSLASLEIASINLAYSSSDEDVNGNTVTGIGSVTMTDGSTRELDDVSLQSSTLYTQVENLPVVSVDVSSLPQIHGFGLLPDLQSAMMLDPALETLVQNLVALPPDTSLAVYEASATSIMYEWAGVAGVDPERRGGLVDARQIEFLEKYTGQDLFFADQWDPSANPEGLPAAAVENSWNATLNYVVARLLVQTVPMISAEFSFDPSSDMIIPVSSLPDALADFSAEIGTLSPSTLDAWSKVAIVLDGMAESWDDKTSEFASSIAQAGVPGLDILQNALGMGVPFSFGSDGRIILGQSLDYGEQPGGHEYVYSAGDGVLEIHNRATQYSTTLNGYTPSSLDLTGIASSDVTTSIDSQGNYVLTIGTDGDQVILDGEGLYQLAPPGTDLLTDGEQYGVSGVQSISFDDGTVWNGLWLTGSTASDTIANPYDGVTYDPRGLSHIIQAVGDNNTLVVNPGCGMVDVVSGGISAINVGGDLTAADVTISADPDDNLTLQLGDGDSLVLDGDIVANSEGGGYTSLLHSITFGDGTSLTVGSYPFQFTYDGADGLYMPGSPVGYDTFNFAPGNDTALGGGLSDTYNFNAGDGNAVILPSGTNGNIVFGPGLNEANAVYTTDAAGDLTVSFVGTADSLTIDGDFYNPGGNSSRIAGATFSAGTAVNFAYLTFTDIVGPGVSYEASPFGNNVFDLGNAAGSTVYGGSMPYNSGNTYNVGALSGAVTIVPGQYGGTVQFGPGVTANMLSFTADAAGDLTISVAGRPPAPARTTAPLRFRAPIPCAGHALPADGLSMLSPVPRAGPGKLLWRRHACGFHPRSCARAGPAIREEGARRNLETAEEKGRDPAQTGARGPHRNAPARAGSAFF